MLCDKCQKRQATVHVERIVNDERVEYNLCEQCAQTQGELGTFFTNPVFSINSLLSALLNDEERRSRALPTEPSNRCPTCNLTYGEFARVGRLGCSDCYDTFSERLDSILRRIQGSVTHVGKVPKRAGAHLALRRQITQFRRELEHAVEQEAYEQAAEIRDRIRALEDTVRQEADEGEGKADGS